MRVKVLSLAAVLGLACGLQSAAGGVICISVNNSGVPVGAASSNCSISYFGRYVAFETFAENIDPPDVNRVGEYPVGDIYIRDRDLDGDWIWDEPGAGTDTFLAVRHPDGAPLGGNFNHWVAGGPKLSHSGTRMLFLTGMNPGSYYDGWCYPCDNRDYSYPLIAELGEPGTEEYWNPGFVSPDRCFAGDGPYDMSGDGNSILFSNTTSVSFSWGIVFPPEWCEYGACIGPILYRNGVYQPVQMNSAGEPLLRAWDEELWVASWEDPQLSTDGSRVVFTTDAENGDLEPGRPDTNGGSDVYVRHVPYGVTFRASVSDCAEQATCSYEPVWSGTPSISGDGAHVAFASNADNLVDCNDPHQVPDTNQSVDIFVRDVYGNRTIRVSTLTGGTQAIAPECAHPSISEDGRFIAFEANISSYIPSLSGRGIFVHDRDVNADGIFDEPRWVYTALVSFGPNGEAPNAPATNPVISGDGRWVAFYSDATNLTSTPPPVTGNVFVAKVYRDFQLQANGWYSVKCNVKKALAPSFDCPGNYNRDGYASRVEYRLGGITRLDIHFNLPVRLNLPFTPRITGWSHINGVLQPPQYYYPSSLTILSDPDPTEDRHMLVLEGFGALPDQCSYKIELLDSVLGVEPGQPLVGDTNCYVRALIGDVIEDGYVKMEDVDIAAGFDINCDGLCNLVDKALCKSRLNKFVVCPDGPADF
jgi:Tol biopolymer transport system component